MTDLERWARWHDRGFRWSNDELSPRRDDPAKRFTREVTPGRTAHELAWEELRLTIGLGAVPWDEATSLRTVADGVGLGALSLNG